jgi:hypothetical protein
LLKKTTLASALAVLTAIALPALAGAAEIPKGDYTCSSSFGYAGTLNIKGNNKYSINDGKKGKYTFSKKHKTVQFKTGDYKTFFGGYIKKSKAVDIYETKSGDFLWSCYR